MGDGEKVPLRLEFNPKIRLEFRELDDALALTPIASDYLQESRTGRNIRHHLVSLLRQSIYSRLAGYDDTNDAERLSQDPANRARRMAIDALGRQFDSSSHPRGSCIQGNQRELGNSGLMER